MELISNASYDFKDGCIIQDSIHILNCHNNNAQKLPGY